MSLGSSGELLSLLRLRDLRLLLLAGLISQTGDWVLATGVAFQVYALTGSTVASAIALLVTQAPQVVLGTVAGVLVDRWDRRRVMIAVNLALAVVITPLTVVRDADQVWIIFVVVAITSALTPFFAAAEVSLLPALVPAEQWITANAVNAQVRNVARLVGAALGGVIIAAGGLLWLVVADIASFALAAVLLLRIRHRTAPTAAGPFHPLRDWVDGLRPIWTSRTLIVIMVFFAITGIGEAAMGTLFAPFVTDVLGGTSRDFGVINSAQAVGGIVGGLLITAYGHRFAPRTLLVGGAILFGLGDLTLFAYPLAFPGTILPAIVIIALVGLPGAALFAGMLTLFQTGTDDRVRGRVFGTLTTVQNAAMLASTHAAGTLAESFGIVPVISAQGGVYLIIGAVVLLVLRRTDGPARTTKIDTTLNNPATTTMLPTMALPSNVRTRTVTDPLAMRALAHPLRVELQGLVAREGSLTAADAARQLGISHALASHHLRQLAKYGFIEPAESDDQRSHPWRITSTDTELQPTEPAARASLDVLERFQTEQASQQLAEWQRRREGEDPAWAEPSGVQQSLLYLTPAELADVRQEWSRIVGSRARDRPIGHADQRPADAVPVSFTLVAVPLEPTEQGG